jgi:PAS domain S-box-containing protein
MIAGTYDAGLVALSVAIAIVASYAAFNLAERVSASGGQRRWAWLTSGAIAMGFAIWSMHYVGMLAFLLPVPVLYHVPTVMLSLVVAVAGAAIALYIVSKKTMDRVDTATAGVCLSGAIVSMHYVGMAAMRSAAMHHYNLGLVVLSVVVAVTFSSGAAWLAFRFGTSHEGFTLIKISAASLMGVGIAGMHYTGIAAAYFVPGPAPLTTHTVEVSTLGAFGIGMTTLLLLGTTLVTIWFDRRLANERLLSHLYSDLQEREAKIRRLVDANIIGIFTWSLDKIVEANEAFLHMLGYSREDLDSGRLQWADLTPTEWRDRNERAMAEIRAIGIIQPFEEEYLRKDDSRVPVLVGATSFQGSDQEGVAFVMDITDRKRAEQERERLRQALTDLARINRVTTMGELTASLAHEIKQPIGAALTDARTCLRWLRREEPDVAEAREAAARVITDVTRASDIISRIGLLFKKGPSERELLDPNQVIQEMMVLLRSEASRYSISIRSDLANDLPKTIADRVQLQQVLMNLMLNGIEAMKDLSPAGQLTITSRRENRQLVISVSDTGMGLPGEQTDRIFDAFFTTKSQGTGMGLSISRTIVEAHGGRLWATANPGRGATFHFSLRTEVEASSTPAA